VLGQLFLETDTLAAMSAQQLDAIRARLISLRDQRNRMVHRASEFERTASARVQGARASLDQARSHLAAVENEVAPLRPELEALERGQPPAADEAGWRSAWQASSARLAELEGVRSALQATAAEAEQVLQHALAEQEAASADQARALARLEHEIADLTREVGRLQAEQPPIEAPDPQFREVLLERLGSLESERSWISEEVAVREERLRRIGAEVAQIRSLLEMHTPDWGRSALESLVPEPPRDRSLPAWKQGVREVLRTASQPLHYRQIADQLAATGRGLGGQDPAETLLAALGRDPDFRRVGRGTYWLASRPLAGRSTSSGGDRE